MFKQVQSTANRRARADSLQPSSAVVPGLVPSSVDLLGVAKAPWSGDLPLRVWPALPVWQVPWRTTGGFVRGHAWNTFETGEVYPGSFGAKRMLGLLFICLQFGIDEGISS